MLHVRVVSPVALTDQLTARLAAAPGVQNVVVRAGAARRPAGDAVEFNAIIGVALGISRRVRSEVRDGLLALGGGFLAAIVLCLLFGLSVRASGATPAAFLQGRAPGRGPDQQAQRLLRHRRRAGRGGGRGRRGRPQCPARDLARALALAAITSGG
jgi:hypothetical protein